ncbi:hypothetical protein BUZ94_13005 [Mammaliicoccus sciuri]|uniref:hypothetical protein n=1 Tax=Mammaliicoccus sciuri TaxID=1296 RepID=UPI000E69CEF9|nr:hypothetical protein [Mammaliicoccus sciuri]RIO07376.1 hypothetical protein BUZ94_13005 [Mammaliicoccus sciuri]
MKKRQMFVNEISLVNSDIILHENMITAYLKNKSEDEYVISAYNNFYEYDDKDNISRANVILIFTNKGVYELRVYVNNHYIDYKKIDYVKSDIGKVSLDKMKLTYMSFGSDGWKTGGSSFHFGAITYYENAKKITNDLKYILNKIKKNPNHELKPLKSKDQSVLANVNVNKNHFADLSTNDFSKNVYKNMLDKKEITEDQYKLLIK